MELSIAYYKNTCSKYHVLNRVQLVSLTFSSDKAAFQTVCTVETVQSAMQREYMAFRVAMVYRPHLGMCSTPMDVERVEV